MAVENSKLQNENNELKKKLDEFEKQIAELKKENDDLKNENAELKAKNASLLQENPEKSVAIRQMKRTHEEEKSKGSGEFNAQINSKKLKKLEQSPWNVPNWLVEVLEWIKRIEMANSSLSFASRLFKQLCWTKLHLNVKKRSIEGLTIVPERDEDSFAVRAIMRHHTSIYKYVYTCVPIPIATEVPEYITNIQELHLFFLDGQVLEFVQHVLPLLNNIRIKFNGKMKDWQRDNIRIPPIRHLLKILATTKTIQLDLYDYSTPENFCHFTNLFPHFVDGVQKLNMTLSRSRSTTWDPFLIWLNDERKDGEPKIIDLHFHYDEYRRNYTQNTEQNVYIERVKQKFARSTLPATFLIQLHRSSTNFMLENKNTGELLALYTNPDPRQGGTEFLTRHRMGMEHLRANWEKHFIRQERETRITMEITEIGNFDSPSSKQKFPSVSIQQK